MVVGGAGLVAGEELDTRAAGISTRLLLPSHFNRRLRGSVGDLATQGDLVRLDIQTVFDFDDLLGRSFGLLVYCFSL